jgi:hypothetical protein
MYFKFLKWMFQLNILLFLLVLLFLVLPEALLTDNSYTAAVTGATGLSNATLLAATCSAAYTVNVSSSAVELVVDFLQGTVRTSCHVIISYLMTLRVGWRKLLCSMETTPTKL